MCLWLLQLFLLFHLVLPAPGAAQARIDVLFPETAAVEVQRLGSDRPELARAGMDLAPGDLLSSSVEDVSVTLRCSAPAGDNTYDLVSPFRVLIDVPMGAPCHVNLLSGTTEVTAEVPSQTSAGGVTLGSTGTEYGVEVRRSADSLVFRCTIYTDSVSILAGPQTLPGGGFQARGTLLWKAGGTFERTGVSREQLARSAAYRARFDLAAAQGKGSLQNDSSSTLRRLQTLHYQVLRNPENTARSVELAKVLLDLDLPEKARYNLERVNVRSEAQLRRLEIDPDVIRRDLPGSYRPLVAPITYQPVVLPGSTTDRDLRLIQDGRAAEAMANLERRVEAGSATSHDYFALAKAHARQGDPAQARANAGRALVLHARDELLSSAELRELGELIARMG